MVRAPKEKISTATNSNKPIKPLHRTTLAEKRESNGKYYRDSADYIKSLSRFSAGLYSNTRPFEDKALLYGVYNNQFPLSWFEHVTNPLATDNEAHKSWAGKIRPVTILRPNLDLLRGEFPKRTFNWTVTNQDEAAFSRYQETMKAKAMKNLEQHFINLRTELSPQDGGIAPAQPAKEVPLPEEYQALQSKSYKDILAMKGQKWISKALVRAKVDDERNRMFKDWVIVGEAYNFTGIQRGQLLYQRISPVYYDFDKSSTQTYANKAEWGVCLYPMTLSDIVETFYDTLEEEDWDVLEKDRLSMTPRSFYNYLDTNLDNGIDRSKIPVYHVVWQGKKRVGYLTYQDPMTGKDQVQEISEEYPASPGEQIDWIWVNEVQETWIVADEIYLGMNPVAVQNGKLPYNGAMYSDTHSTNISLLQIGIPFQILYIILTFKLERFINQSKGKVVIIDKSSIPNTKGWTEEKFFYYIEGQGYAVIDRSQIGVDKSFNQFQVLDMSMFESIQQMISLLESIKAQWDDILGITRQRKGQSYASDTNAANERAVFQSTVITDMIFSGFEGLMESDLSTFLDYMAVLTASGENSIYDDGDLNNIVLEITPQETLEKLGIVATRSSAEQDKLKKFQAYAEAMINSGGMKGSTALEVLSAGNIVTLKAQLEKAEEIERQWETQKQELEQNSAVILLDKQKELITFEGALKEQLMNAEYDRKEIMERIRGDFNIHSFMGGGDTDSNGVPDSTEIMALAHESRMQSAEIAMEGYKEGNKNALEKRKLDQKDTELKLKGKEIEIKRMVAKKPKPAAK